MRALLICLIPVHGRLFVGEATLAADNNKDAGKFSPGPASSYPAKQTNDHVTVAVAAYDTEELAHTAFGKLNPNQYGVLPVLVIIQNDTDQALKLDHLDVEYTGVDGRRVEATPADEVQTLGGTERPNVPVATPDTDPSQSTRIRWMCGKSMGDRSRPSCCRRMNRQMAFSIFKPRTGRVRNST